MKGLVSTAERRDGAMVRSTGMRTRIRAGSRWRVIAVGACLVAGATACSSGSGSASSPPATSPAPGSATASTGPASAAAASATPSSAGSDTAAAFAGSVTNYRQFTGGSGKANASLSPVTIGWVNEQGGPPSQTFPQATLAAQATVKFINAELGGVHGHPVQLSTC